MNYEKYAVPALHLVRSNAINVFSKLGGLPNLPKNVEWPTWNDAPLCFLCQIAISETPEGNFLKEAISLGYLYFFYSTEEPWGYDPKHKGGWKVIYSDQHPSPVAKNAPKDLNEDYIFPEKFITFKTITSIPDPQRLTGAGEDLSDKIFEEILEEKRLAYVSLPQHQMGGYPVVVQDDEMEHQCQLVSNGLYCGDSTGYEDPQAAELSSGSSEWRLLLQVDTDDDVCMMWGDCGLIYFWIRESDLKNKDFDKSWLILQCG